MTDFPTTWNPKELVVTLPDGTATSLGVAYGRLDAIARAYLKGYRITEGCCRIVAGRWAVAAIGYLEQQKKP